MCMNQVLGISHNCVVTDYYTFRFPRGACGKEYVGCTSRNTSAAQRFAVFLKLILRNVFCQRHHYSTIHVDGEI